MAPCLMVLRDTLEIMAHLECLENEVLLVNLGHKDPRDLLEYLAFLDPLDLQDQEDLEDNQECRECLAFRDVVSVKTKFVKSYINF